MTDEQVDQVILANAEAFKKRYLGYTSKLIRSLVMESRRNGYALNPGLIWPGSWGVGVAILGPNGTPVGALNISAIESRLAPPRQKELAVHLQREAKWLTEQLSQRQAPKSSRRQAQRSGSPSI
jgi:DNA-binding IclR family transcriptional regulator